MLKQLILLKSSCIVLFSFSLMAKEKNSLVSIPEGFLKSPWLETDILSKLVDAAKAKPIDPSEQKKIKIQTFLAMPHQVSVKNFRAFLIKNPKWQRENTPSLFADFDYLKNIAQNDDSQAITYVSWFAARAYCESLDMRLPTLTEWEFMAQADESSVDASSKTQFQERILSWYGQPSDQSSLKRPQFRNFYGVYDLHGYVWEWVDDFNNNLSSGEGRNAASRGLFCGGGGQISASKEDYASFMRFAFRSSLNGRDTLWNLSFRCVR